MMTLAIPEKCLPIIFHMYHDSLWSGHLGVKKTYQAIKDKYFCPNLFSKLQQYIKACSICQEFKVPKTTEEKHDFIPRMLESHQPFAYIHLDFKYVFPATTGHKFLLVIADTCTRYCMAYPLRAISALDVAEILTKEIFFTHGFPLQINTDQGVKKPPT